MGLEINSAACSVSIIMQFRPDSRPERSKYNHLYPFFYEYVIYSGTKNFQYVFAITGFKMPEQELRQHKAASVV
jgi:hypothetical protein